MNTTLSLVTLLVAPLCAQAAEGVDLERICTAQDGGARHIQPVELVYAALDSAPGTVSRGVFDVNRDGIETMPERLSAIFDTTYCAKQDKPVCAEGDQGSLDDVRNLLEGMIGTTVVAERISTPTALDIRDRPMLDDAEYGEMAQVFDENKRYFRLSCAARPVDANAVVADAAPKFERFRLTGDIDSLALPRGSREKLGAVAQAEISYVDDREEDSQTFNVAAFCSCLSSASSANGRGALARTSRGHRKPA